MSSTISGPTALLIDSLKTSTSTTNSNSEESTSSDLEVKTTITTIGEPSISISPTGIIQFKPVIARGLSSSKVDSKKKSIHQFKPRISAFDRDNPNSSKDYSFSGFFTLFWIFLFVGGIRTAVWHYDANNVPYGSRFASLMSEDAKMLALSDCIMVTVTFICVPFIKMINSGWIRYKFTGMILQHVFQTLFLFVGVRWGFYREWQWVQRGFFTLHTLSTLMKVHSYCSHNGQYSEYNREFKLCQLELSKLIESLGGSKLVEEEAKVNWEKELEDGNVEIEEEKEDQRISKMKEYEVNVERNLGAVASDSSLRRRRSSSRRHSTILDDTLSTPTSPSSSSSESTTITTPSEGLDLLTWHPNSKINSLAIKTADLRDLMTSTGATKISFPNNITYTHFLDFLLVPTLVYQLEYPRTEKIRFWYVLEKAAATLGTLTLLILIVEHYILPISPAVHDNSFLTSALDLAIPFMVNYLLIFYIIFETIANGFAELTRFADRKFYEDWWNSQSFEEFSRKWNIPVHAFLFLHVYTATRITFGFSKSQAAFVTFLLSALVHELVMAVVTQKIRPYLFGAQMLQLPMIFFLNSMPIMKKYPAVGNLLFWIGLLSGFPVLATLYLRF